MFVMSIKKLFFILTGISILLTGCNDFLDVKPMSTLSPDTFYETEQEAALAIAPVYSDLARDDTYGRELSMHFEAGTDETAFSRSNNNWAVAINHYNAGTIAIRNSWARIYRGINHANFFIKRIENSNIDEAAKLRYM